MNDIAGQHITNILPHRGAALLVDRIIDISTRTRSGVVESAFTPTAVATLRQRLATMDDAHEAGENTVPLLFVVEAFAQACGVVWSLTEANDIVDPPGLVLGAARGIEFHTTTNAGVALRHHVVVDSDSGSTATFSGRIVTSDGGATIATVESLLAVRNAHTSSAADERP